MKKFYVLIFLVFLSLYPVLGQTTPEELYKTPEKTGGVYYAYPTDIAPQTPAPSGFEPFYISHYGRHGSRYLINDEDYKWVLDLFEDAKNSKALTPLGLDVYSRLTKVWVEAEGRGGDLSPLGVRQHRGIAERMYTSFPEVFSDNVNISARSTIAIRCILSMDAFCERLKELNPTLRTNRDASHRWMNYLNFHTKRAVDFRSAKDTWTEEYRKFEESHTRPQRLIASLFSDNNYVSRKVNPNNVMWGLYWIASDMQNMETDQTFYDLFEKEELFDLWQCPNYRFYVNDASNSLNGKIMLDNAKPLLRNIIESANEVIGSEEKGATLRFGHDGNIIPLVSVLHLANCYGDTDNSAEIYKVWSDFAIVPMAANVQIIFFRKKKSDDIIVKFLLNEKETLIPPVDSDILPFYHWKDIEKYYKSILDN